MVGDTSVDLVVLDMAVAVDAATGVVADSIPATTVMAMDTKAAAEVDTAAAKVVLPNLRTGTTLGNRLSLEQLNP